mmetsp:Transcript_67860/g.118996  ORF Transcript_67860/g.118996 Transcript_67860/m.118996 type:complete len:361 (+) Transcript_67860:46-1128(+)
MGSACKPQCQKPSEAGDDVGLEPTTPVADTSPCINVGEAVKTAEAGAPEDAESKVAEAAVVPEPAAAEDSQAANAAAEPAAEADAARKSAEESGVAAPPPEPEEVQPAASEEAAAKAQEAKDGGSKDPAKSVDAESERPHDGHINIGASIENEATEKEKPDKAAAKKTVIPEAERKKRAAKAAAAAKKKKAAEDKKHAEEEAKTNADNEAKQKADEGKAKESESGADKVTSKKSDVTDKSTSVAGWGTPEALQAIFAEDPEEDQADLVQQYFQAVTAVTKGKPKKGAPGNEEKMTLYGLFKQVNEGDVNKPKPGMLAGLEARGKWIAWNSRKGMDKKSAMEEYVKVVRALKTKYQFEVPS